MQRTMGSRSTIYGVAFAVGLCGLVAQVVVVREMLTTFYGNELSMGVVLAAWPWQLPLPMFWAVQKASSCLP